ncbi:CD276 antigen homolog isoform X2 [Leucoraja erinacea]|uniref:CD276 antigen homolog isoform X2 n=1 Tax=Leucoraja erinaceus TaxID=7782 RepID=UPI002456B800|nr:CD276 antigen homolog isoform X2 [Leucoraja erinacea]
MRPRFLCNSLPAGLMLGFFVFLLQPVSTQKNRNRMYFLDNGDEIVLNGTANAEKDTVVVWEWKPHSGKEIGKLSTFRRTGSYWTKEKIDGNLYPGMKVNTYTLALTIDKPTFKWAGIFTLTQTEPIKQILKQYEIFGMKVEASPQKPLLGSDVTLSCTISRLSDTVSLHWRPMDSSQQNRGNTDQIRLDNTVYLMVRHVTVEDGNLYVCEVRENGNILHTSNAGFTVDNVTAEPSDAVTEGDTVTLTCSVSHVIGSMRLVWINGDGKRVGEKTLTEEEKSLSLVIQKAERGRGNWRCVLFDQDLPRLFVPYQEPSGK